MYEEYIGDLLSDDGIMTVPNEEETICVNLKGEKVLSIEYELDEAFRDGWLSLGRAYSDEDANVYHYIEKYATSESDWDGQDTTEYIEESSADTNIQNGENNQEETNTTTQDTNISTENTTEYILPDSDSRYISENELGGMSSEQLRLARNEILHAMEENLKMHNYKNILIQNHGTHRNMMRILLMRIWNRYSISMN